MRPAVLSTPLRAALGALMLGFGLFLLPVRAAGAELVVIVSAKSTVEALRREQVTDIFLGRVAEFTDGADAVALDQSIGSPLRDEFYTKLTNKTPSLVKAYWTKMIFTGRGLPPKEIPNSLAVRRLVADNPAMIGYIDRNTLDASVRAVLVVQ